MSTLDFVVLLDERGKEYRSVDFSKFIEQKNGGLGESSYFRNWWTVWLFVGGLCASKPTDFIIEDDVLPSDDTYVLCGAALSCFQHYARGTLSSRIIFGVL